MFYFFKREQNRKSQTKRSKAKRLNETSAGEIFLLRCLFESLFFFLESWKSAVDPLSFPGGECVLPAVFSLLGFCQCFAQSGMPFDPMSDCPGPIHLSKPWAVQVPTSL